MHIEEDPYTEKIINKLKSPIFLKNHNDLYNDIVTLNEILNENNLTYDYYEYIYLKYLKDITDIRIHELIFNHISYTNEGIEKKYEKEVHTCKVVLHSLLRIATKRLYADFDLKPDKRLIVDFDNKVIYKLIQDILKKEKEINERANA